MTLISCLNLNTLGECKIDDVGVTYRACLRARVEKVGMKDRAKSTYKWVFFAIVAAIGGLWFVGCAGSYLIDYLKDSADNPYRHEYLEGLTLSLTFSSPFWLMLAAFSAPLKKSMPKPVFLLTRVPAIIVGIAFVVMHLFILAMVLLDKLHGK